MWRRSSSQHASERHWEVKNWHKSVPAVDVSWAHCRQAQPRGLRKPWSRMAPSPPPGMMPLGVQDIVRWARWKAVNQGHPCSILKPVALSPTLFLICTEFKGVMVKRRGREVFLVLQKGLLTPFCSGGVGLLFHLQACLLYCCKGGAGMLGQAPTYSSPQGDGAVFALPVH